MTTEKQMIIAEILHMHEFIDFDLNRVVAYAKFVNWCLEDLLSHLKNATCDPTDVLRVTGLVRPL